MESKWKYLLTQKAERDLEDIVHYIAVELANKTVASDFMDKLQAAIEEAKVFPASGSLAVNEFLPNMGIRKKLINNYLMYYLPDFEEKRINILRIAYGRRNVDEILRQMNI